LLYLGKNKWKIIFQFYEQHNYLHKQQVIVQHYFFAGRQRIRKILKIYFSKQKGKIQFQRRPKNAG